METSNPKAIAAGGEEIYDQRYRANYEANHNGKFVAIDVNSQEAYLGETAEQALETARSAAPSGVFYLIKVGSAYGFRAIYSANEHIFTSNSNYP